MLISKLLPVPVFQLAPASVLYSQVAPVSRPLTLTVPARVMASLLLVPVSLASVISGATTLVSTTNLPLLLVLKLPLSATTLSV